MHIETLATSDAVAARAAQIIASAARNAVAARGRFVMAVSGGRTPWQMLRALANEDVPWASVHVVQVDERIAPDGDKDRNLTHLRESLLSHAPIPESHIHAMPVNATDLDQACSDYTATLESLCGHPPTLDLAHLGLGPDGHTASLFPEGKELAEGLSSDAYTIAATPPVAPHQRLSLTAHAILQSRHIFLQIGGAGKKAVYDQALAGGPVEELPIRLALLQDKVPVEVWIAEA